MRVKAALLVMATGAVLTASCTNDAAAPSGAPEQDAVAEATSPTARADEPAPTPDRAQRFRPTLKEIRQAAAADGRIDRREAIRLALGVPKKRVKDVEASLEGGRWSVILWGRLGCHTGMTLDAETGRPGRTAGGGCS